MLSKKTYHFATHMSSSPVISGESKVVLDRLRPRQGAGGVKTIAELWFQTGVFKFLSNSNLAGYESIVNSVFFRDHGHVSLNISAFVQMATRELVTFQVTHIVSVTICATGLINENTNVGEVVIACNIIFELHILLKAVSKENMG